MLRRQFFGFELTLGAAGADENDLRAESRGGFELYGRSVARHHDDGFDVQSPRGVGDALSVIAAGIGDDAAAALFFRQGSDFVVGSAQFEGADGLLVFGLEKEAAGVGFRMVKFDEMRANGYAEQAGLCGSGSR